MIKDAAHDEAVKIIEDLLKSGDQALFDAARGPDGKVDQMKLVSGCWRATLKVAAKIRAGEI
jgi:hypothetical protein